jgi:hypothetical protein
MTHGLNVWARDSASIDRYKTSAVAGRHFNALAVVDICGEAPVGLILVMTAGQNRAVVAEPACAGIFTAHLSQPMKKPYRGGQPPRSCMAQAASFHRHHPRPQ